MKLMTTTSKVIKVHWALDQLLPYLEDVAYTEEGEKLSAAHRELVSLHDQYLGLLTWMRNKRAERNEASDGQTQVPLAWPCTLPAPQASVGAVQQ